MDKYLRLANRYKRNVNSAWGVDGLTRLFQTHFQNRDLNFVTDSEITNLLKYLPTGTNFWGALKDGFNLSQKAGYLGEDDKIHPRFSIPFYQSLPAGNPIYPSSTADIGYRIGRVFGDLAGNAHRSILWRSHPADLTATQSYKMIVNSPDGLNSKTLEAAALGTAGAFLATEALGQFSGNYNPLNIGEGMRPAGFQALSPDKDDATKSTSPALDVVQRYLLGRRGRILDWEDFKVERPDISYEKYQAYRDWQSGKSPDPLGSMTLGLVKFNPDGLQNLPEAQIVGYNVTPAGVLAAGGVIGAGVLLNKHLNNLARQSL